MRRASPASVRAALCIALLAAYGCTQPADKPPEPRKESGIELPDPSLKFLGVEMVGAGSAAAGPAVPGRLTMRPQAAASVGAPTSGRIVSVLVRPGEAVAAGKVLLTLQSADAAGARASLASASARAAAAEEALRRQNEMLAKGVGLELERLEAETKAREARAELERARRASALIGAGQGDVVSVRAPTGGTVMAVKAAVGAMVAPGGEALVEIADTARLWAVADILESDTASVRRGQRVLVKIPAANRQLSGIVDGLGSRIEADTRRLPVYVSLEGGFAGLAPGMQAELQFAAANETLSVPTTAVLIKDGKRRVVYVQRADGRFEAREVRVGTATSGRVTILEGLASGERIVVKGALLLDAEAEQML